MIDTDSRVAFATRYDRNNARVAAEMLNDRVVPGFEEQDVALRRLRTDRSTEYGGSREHHSLDALQRDREGWPDGYHQERTHSGRYGYGKTPLQTFRETQRLAQEKRLDRP